MAQRKAKPPARKKPGEKRGAPKGKFKNPPFVATEEQKRAVMILRATGKTQEMIALKLGISEDTLIKHFPHELSEGLEWANSELGGVLYKKAHGGDTKALEMWFDRRGGPEWRKKTGLEHSGLNGAPIQTRDVTKLTDAQVAALAALDDSQ